jgi:hypothetical protein
MITYIEILKVTLIFTLNPLPRQPTNIPDLPQFSPVFPLDIEAIGV